MADVNAIIERFNRLKSDRDGSWVQLWREVGEYVQPNKVAGLSAGGKRGANVFDPTAGDANIRLAAGLFAWLTPVDKRWFELQPRNEALQHSDAVKRWFSAVNRIIYDAISNSNWPLEVHECYLDLGAVGTACLYIEEGDRSMLNFLSIRVDNIAIAEDKEGRVDTVFREFDYTARQCVQEWGEDKLSDKIKTAYRDDKRKDEKFRIVHAVMPRNDRKAEKLDSKEMPIASYYIELEGRQLIEESGYWEMPYVVFRFSKGNDEVYGRCPGMDALPEIKMLNRMRKTKTLGAEKAVDPPILIPDDGLIDNTFRSGPGGINYYRPGAGGVKPEPFYDGSNLAIVQEEINESRGMVKTMFYNDMFDALGDRRNMTATEIVERVEAKLIPFSPVLGRMQAELFAPALMRIFGIAVRGGFLPPAPPELLADPHYRIEYVSRLALAVKQLETRGLTQTLDLVAPLLQMKPEMLDHFDTDAIVRGLSRNNGIPNDWIRPADKVERLRQERAEAMAQQQRLAEQQMMADAAPKLGKRIEPGSPLAMLNEGGPQGA